MCESAQIAGQAEVKWLSPCPLHLGLMESARLDPWRGLEKRPFISLAGGIK